MRAPELEAKLLGAVLDSDEPIKLLQQTGLRPESFSDAQLRVCWSVAWDLARQGRKVNALTLFSAGKTTNQLRDEDFAFLQGLQLRNDLRDPRAFNQVANDLRRYSHSRLLGRELSEIGKELLSGQANPERVYGRFQAIAANYSQLHAEGRRGSDAVLSGFEAFDRRKAEGKRALVTTGLALLDAELGGFPPKLCAIVGKPGVGKSALLGTMLERQLASGMSVLLFSLEDGDQWLVKRHLAKRLSIPVGKVFDEEFPDGDKASEVAQQLTNEFAKLWICTKKQARTPADIVRIATQYIAQQDVGCIWLDNVTAVKPQLNGKFDQPRNAIGRMYEGFAEFADTYHIPFVALAHTTRDYEKRTDSKLAAPKLSDIAETADADRAIRFALGLWRKGGELRTTVLKHTEGPADATFGWGMHFDAALVDADSGRHVNLQAEERKERAERDERKAESSVAMSFRRDEVKKKYIEGRKPTLEVPVAEPEKTPEPQLDLLAPPAEVKA